MKPTVAAVIPHWNRRELLEALLANLAAQTRPFDDIIVVDNGSTDGSADAAERAGARVLRLETNLGFAAAVNRGIETAETEWVAILNNDITLASDWLALLLQAAEREQVWFATGKLLRHSDPTIIDGTFDEISRAGCACRCGSGKPDSPVWNVQRRIRFAPMTAALFRRELFTTLGGLDQNFGSYLEDVDFGMRCALAGHAGLYVPAATGLHRGSSTLGEWNSDTVRQIARNQILLAAKYLRSESRWPILAGQLLWALLAVRHRTGMACLKGKFSGIKMARCLKQHSSDAVRLRALLEASEKEILAVQRQAGFDWYWRMYFWLLRR
jgi:GT2 family glycosyltransferase